MAISYSEQNHKAYYETVLGFTPVENRKLRRRRAKAKENVIENNDEVTLIKGDMEAKKEDHVNRKLQGLQNEAKEYIIENNDKVNPIKGDIEAKKEDHVNRKLQENNDEIKETKNIDHEGSKRKVKENHDSHRISYKRAIINTIRYDDIEKRNKKIIQLGSN